MFPTTQTHDPFSAVADPIRRQILSLLAEQAMPVRQLTEHFSVSRPAISRHLRILKQAGLVSGEKRGRQRIYHLQPERLAELRRWVLYFDQYWQTSLHNLKSYVEEDLSDE